MRSTSPGYYSDVALIAKQARLIGLTQALLGADGWDAPGTQLSGGDALDKALHYNSLLSQRSFACDSNVVDEMYCKQRATATCFGRSCGTQPHFRTDALIRSRVSDRLTATS